MCFTVNGLPSGLRAIWSVSLWRMTSNGPCCSRGRSKFSCQHVSPWNSQFILQEGSKIWHSVQSSITIGVQLLSFSFRYWSYSKADTHRREPAGINVPLFTDRMPSVQPTNSTKAAKAPASTWIMTFYSNTKWITSLQQCFFSSAERRQYWQCTATVFPINANAFSDPFSRWAREWPIWWDSMKLMVQAHAPNMYHTPH